MKNKAKVSLGLGMMAILGQSALAAEIQLSEVQRVVSASLDPTSVKCSNQGYRIPELKILVPNLRGVTLLDHRKPGEPAPCISAGACTATLTPELILNSQPFEVNLPVVIRMVKVTTLDATRTTCSVILREDVTARLGKLQFFSRATKDLGTVSASECQ